MAAYGVVTADFFNTVTEGVFGGPMCQGTDGVHCLEPLAPEITTRPPGAGRRKYYADDVDLEELKRRTRGLRDRRDLQDILDLLRLLQEV